MALRPVNRRMPRDHERVWNGHFVDKNLHDDWLERLNALACFNLISICEGHREHLRQRSPDINLRVKSEHFCPLLDMWHQHRYEVVQLVDQSLYADDIGYDVSLSGGFRHSQDQLHDTGTCVFRIHHRRQGRGQATDVQVEHWFDNIVKRVEELDRALWNLLQS